MNCDPIKPEQVGQEIFLAAERFSAALNALSRSGAAAAADDVLPGYDMDTLLTLPGVVLEAFSIELYLKSLHAVAGVIPPPRGHDVWKLFSGLKSTVQMELKRSYDKLMTQDPHIAHKAKVLGRASYPSLEEQLKSASSVFTDIRYPWEEDFRVRNFDVGPFRLAVRALILDKRPDYAKVLKSMTIRSYLFTPCGPNCRGILSLHHRRTQSS